MSIGNALSQWHGNTISANFFSELQQALLQYRTETDELAFNSDMRREFSTQLKNLVWKGEAAHSSQRMRIPTSWDDNGFFLPYAEDAAS